MLRLVAVLATLAAVALAQTPDLAGAQPVCCELESLEPMCMTRSQCAGAGGTETCNFCDLAAPADSCETCDALTCCLPAGAAADGVYECLPASDCEADMVCASDTCAVDVWFGEICGCTGPAPTPAPTPPPTPAPAPGDCRTTGCDEAACESCVTVAGGAFECRVDESKLDACGKCDSDCKVVAENLAITGDGCLVVDGVNILERIRDLERRCGALD